MLEVEGRTSAGPLLYYSLISARQALGIIGVNTLRADILQRVAPPIWDGSGRRRKLDNNDGEFKDRDAGRRPIGMNYLEKFSLTGKRAVITGGARGIGFEICRALGQAGAAIVLADLDEEVTRSAAATLMREGIEVSYKIIDVTKSADVTAVADDLNAERSVDILINNAGVGPRAEALDTLDEVWSKTMSVNSDAPFWCSRAFGHHMTARSSGNIVNIGSMCGLIVTQPQNNTCYIASKGALHMMTKSLACAWAKFNVRVNAVAPGYIATDMLNRFKTDNDLWHDRWIQQTPLGRMGTPQEIASAVLYLASDASSYCTGTILSADGGYTSL